MTNEPEISKEYVDWLMETYELTWRQLRLRSDEFRIQVNEEWMIEQARLEQLNQAGCFERAWAYLWVAIIGGVVLLLVSMTREWWK